MNEQASDLTDPSPNNTGLKYWWVGGRDHLIAVAAIILTFVLVAGLIVSMRSANENAGDPVATPSTMPQETSIPEVKNEDTVLDADNDGLTDKEETGGWIVASGETFFTDPFSQDTDSDGLSDGIEAGEAQASEGQSVVYAGVSDPTKSDTDDDGLSDAEELKFGTDPKNSDTDGDGLSDYDEVELTTSDPLKADTDDDGVDDAEEANSGTDPHQADTDDDGLSDYDELYKYETDPASEDTDGDGLKDGYEVKHQEEKGFDPQFHDEKISKTVYATQFLTGAIAGDVVEINSLAWLAGNIAMSGAGFLPVVGAFISGVVDVRDLIFATVTGNWVGVGFSAIGLVPFYGDAAKVPATITKFVKKNPQKAPGVAMLVAKIPGLSETVRTKWLKITYKSWDEWVESGASPNSLLKVAVKGRNNLDTLAKFRKRPGHVPDAPVRFMPTGQAGELYLETSLMKKGVKEVSTQVSMKTTDCVVVCNLSHRKIDVLADGVAHESKVGYVSLQPTIRKQIESDAFLIKGGEITKAHWHFYPSGRSHKMGPNKDVIDLLDQKGISYTIYAPK